MATIAEVRELINEDIPVGGTEADTLFTDVQVQAWIDATTTTDSAVVLGWRAKAAKYSDLVDTAEGTSKRAMSDLLANALKMLKLYGVDVDGSGPVVTTPRTRRHKLTRD